MAGKSLTAEQQAALQKVLEQLPERAAIRLASAIETDRLRGGSKLPHDIILKGLRPTLLDLYPPPAHIPTPMRLFFEPFEDFIYDGWQREKQRGRVSRSSVTPIWNWLADKLMGQELNRISDTIIKHVICNDQQALADATAELHKTTAAALSGALKGLQPDTKAYKQVSKELGDARVIEDARDILSVLEVAPLVLEVKALLPRPILDIGDEEIDILRPFYDTFNEKYPDHLPSLLLIVMGRMPQPWLILRVTQRLTNADSDLLISRTNVGIVGELLFEEAESLAKYFYSIRSIDEQVEEVLLNLTYFTNLMSGITQELGIRKDGKWGKRLLACRTLVSEAMEHHIERLPRMLDDALPTGKFGRFGAKGVVRPDLSDWPKADRITAASQLAILLDGSRDVAGQAAFGALHKEMFETSKLLLVNYGERIVDEIRSREGEDRERAQAYLDKTVELTRIILGDTDADLLVRRGRAAVA